MNSYYIMYKDKNSAGVAVVASQLSNAKILKKTLIPNIVFADIVYTFIYQCIKKEIFLT